MITHSHSFSPLCLYYRSILGFRVCMTWGAITSPTLPSPKWTQSSTPQRRLWIKIHRCAPISISTEHRQSITIKVLSASSDPAAWIQYCWSHKIFLPLSNNLNSWHISKTPYMRNICSHVVLHPKNDTVKHWSRTEWLPQDLVYFFFTNGNKEQYRYLENLLLLSHLCQASISTELLLYVRAL